MYNSTYAWHQQPHVPLQQTHHQYPPPPPLPPREDGYNFCPVPQQQETNAQDAAQRPYQSGQPLPYSPPPQYPQPMTIIHPQYAHTTQAFYPPPPPPPPPPNASLHYLPSQPHENIPAAYPTVQFTPQLTPSTQALAPVHSVPGYQPFQPNPNAYQGYDHYGSSQSQGANYHTATTIVTTPQSVGATSDPLASLVAGVTRLALKAKQSMAQDLSIGVPVNQAIIPLTGLVSTAPQTFDSNPSIIRPLTQNGPYSDPLDNCPKETSIMYESLWYHHKDSHSFTVCTRCHLNFIANSPFVHDFIGYRKAADIPGKCRFVPRITKQLWRKALATNDLDQVIDYVKVRSSIPDCKGMGGAVASARIKWYKTLDEQPEGFVVCEACYEDKIVPTSFASQFRPGNKRQQPGEVWACDLAAMNINRALETYAPSHDWQSFFKTVEYRIKLPVCEGKVVQGHTRKWFRPKRTIPDIGFCETCYYDRIALTSFADEFEQIPHAEVQAGGDFLCDLKMISMIVALDVAQKRKDFNKFWTAANAIMQQPRCVAEEESGGLTGGTWYTLANGCEDFEICGGCYAGIVLPNINPPSTVHQYFQPANRDPNQVLLCDLNPAAPRFNGTATKLDEAFDKRQFSIFSSYVRKFASIPSCPKMMPEADRTWYGYEDCTVCEDCYYSFVEGTALANQMDLKGTVADSTPRTCDMYSPRMRGMWEEGSRMNTSASMRRYADYRRKVYGETIIPATELAKQLKAKEAMIFLNGRLSSGYNRIDCMNNMMGANNSSSGWFGNKRYHSFAAAQSAMYMQKMSNGIVDMAGMEGWGKVKELEEKWKEVE